MAGAVKIRENKLGFNSQTAGSPSRIRLPQNRGILKQIKYRVTDDGTAASQADLEAHYPQVTFEVNGDDFSIYKTMHLLMLQAYNGDDFEAGVIPLSFSNHTLDNVYEQDATALTAAAYNNPTLVLDVAGTATAPVFTQEIVSEGLGNAGRDLVKRSPAQASGLVAKHYREILDILSSGNQGTTIEYLGGGQRVKALHIKGSNITRIRILVNEQEWYDFKSRADLVARLKEHGYTAQTDWWHIDFVALANTINGAFDPMYGGTKQRLDFEIFTSDTNDVELLAETFDRPDTLAPDQVLVA